MGWFVEYNKSNRIYNLKRRKPGNQEVEYKVTKVSGLNIEIRSVYSILHVAGPFMVYSQFEKTNPIFERPK